MVIYSPFQVAIFTIPATCL